MFQLAKDATIAQLWAALSTAALIVVVMAKHFKDFLEALPSLVKAWKYFQKKWFADAIFRKDVMTKLDNMNIQVLQVKKEVQYNGGSITLSDAVKRLEKLVLHNQGRRDITDLCSDRMIFRMNDEGACVFINDAFLKTFGCTESEILDFAFENLVHDDDVAEMRLKWQKAITTKTAFKDEQRIIDCNNVFHKCRVVAHPIVVDGRLIEFSGIIDLLK